MLNFLKQKEYTLVRISLKCPSPPLSATTSCPVIPKSILMKQRYYNHWYKLHQILAYSNLTFEEEKINSQ